MTAKKRIWKSGIIVSLLIATAFAGLLVVPETNAATITVPTDYATISAAISAASAGDTIVVLAGTYDISSEIKVSKTLTIRGQGDTTIIDGGGTVSIIFNITATKVNISNMKIQHAGSIGVNIGNTYAKIDNCTITLCPIGVNITASGDDATIENSTISYNDDAGISVYGARARIQYNTIEYNGAGSAEGGIIVQDADTNNMTVYFNDIRYNNQNGIYIYDDGENATEHEDMLINYNNIYDNTVYGINYQESATNGSTLDAEDNWWGDPTGPYSPDTSTIGLNRDASGDEINAPNVEVDYISWLDAPWDASGNYAHRSYNVWEGTTSVDHTYLEIYDALSNANTANGDTINIRRGHYHLRTAAMNSTNQCLLITDSITLRAMEPNGNTAYTYDGSHPDGAGLTGSAPEIYILDAWNTALTGGTGDGIISVISALDNVNITGLTIRRGGTGTYGIHIVNTSADNISISNCIIEYCDSGIVYNGGNQSKIYDNTIRNNTNYGIKYLTGKYVVIYNNTIEYNGDGDATNGGLYLPNSDPYVCVAGNTFKNNDDDGIYIAKATSSYESVIHYNNFRDNVLYGIESAGATVNAQYNCWYNSTAGAWGGGPGDAGVDNYSSSVDVTPYYNGSVTAGYAALATNATASTHDARTRLDVYATFNENHTYDPFVMFAKFSALPIGTAPSGYTPFAKYLAFNISGRSANGLTTGEWINIRVYYTSDDIPSGVSESTIKGLWHYNGSAWVKVSSTKNTTNTGTYSGYVYANFTSNPTSPILILGNKPPTARFTYSPDDPTTDDEIEFNAAGSSDSDGSISTYSWDFGDDEKGTGKTVEHQYDEAGTYTVKLTVTDNAGDSATYEKTITVTSAQVTPGLGVSPGSGDYDLTVSVVYGGLPVSGAYVALYSGNVFLSSGFTDTSGVVTFNNVEGTYRVTAEKSGYKTASTYVTVTSDTTITLILGKATITEAELMGFNFFEWILIIFLIVAFLIMLLAAFGDKSYRKHYRYALLFNILVIIFEMLFALIGLITFSLWFVIAPVLLIALTIGLCWDEISRDITGW